MDWDWAISSRLVRLMGSEITLESEPGEGSDFSFTLHLDFAKEQQADQEEKQENCIFDGAKVLIVEDNELNRRLFRQFCPNIIFRRTAWSMENRLWKRMKRRRKEPMT